MHLKPLVDPLEYNRERFSHQCASEVDRPCSLASSSSSGTFVYPTPSSSDLHQLNKTSAHYRDEYILKHAIPQPFGTPAALQNAENAQMLASTVGLVSDILGCAASTFLPSARTGLAEAKGRLVHLIYADLEGAAWVTQAIYVHLESCHRADVKGLHLLHLLSELVHNVPFFFRYIANNSFMKRMWKLAEFTSRAPWACRVLESFGKAPAAGHVEVRERTACTVYFLTRAWAEELERLYGADGKDEPSAKFLMSWYKSKRDGQQAHETGQIREQGDWLGVFHVRSPRSTTPDVPDADRDTAAASTPGTWSGVHSPRSDCQLPQRN